MRPRPSASPAARACRRVALRLLCTLGALPAIAGAQPVPTRPVAPAPAECVGLVLGGGGARGAAHIGVLKVLERERIPVCHIAGTSMGAIVGGLYASGYSTAELETLIDTIDWADMFVDDPPRQDQPMRRKDGDFRYLLDLEIGFVDGHVVMPGGLVQGQKLLLLLRRLTLSTSDAPDFDALPIPFRAIAADIVTGDKVVFSDGDLALAIRSSMSVPGAFAPIRVDGRLLVDGGMVDNVPIDIVRDMGATRIIAVDVGSPLHDEASLTNPVVIMDQMIGALMREKTVRQLETLDTDDMLITPALGDITAAEFNRGSEAIEIGERAAEESVAGLRRYSIDPAAYARLRASQRAPARDPRLVAFLDVAATRAPSATGTVQRSMAGIEGKPLDVDDLETRIGDAYGTGNFLQIDYRLVERDGQRGLQILPVQKPWSVFGKIGFQLNDDFNGRSSYQVSAEITATNLNDWGGEWRNTLRAGRAGGLVSEFHQPLGETGAFFVEPSIEIGNETLPLWLDGQQLAEYRVNSRLVGVLFGFSPAPTWRLSAGLIGGRDKGERLVGNPADFQTDTQRFAGMVYNATWDSLDSINFPTRGLRVSADLEMYRDAARGDVEGDVARLSVDWAYAWGRYHLLLGTYLTSAFDDANFYRAQSFLGGFLNLSGFQERALFGNQSALLRAVAYRRTGDLSKLFSLPVYVGASLEWGNTWGSRDAVDASDLILAGSLFTGVDTPLGPMFLGYGYNEESQGSWYLTFGALLRPSVR